MFTSIEQRRRTNSPRPGPGINLEAEMKKGKKRWDVRVFLMGVGCLLLLAAVLLSFFNGETQSSSPVVQLSHANSLKHAKDEVVNVSLPVVGSKPFSAVKKEALESLARLNNETRVDHDNKASEGSEAKREEAGQNGDASSVGRQTFEASPQSLQKHKVPRWFQNAKLGIFIHWGVYSVPAYAPLSRITLGGDNSKKPADPCKGGWFKCNPYAEWYGNTMHIRGSPTARHHEETYGRNFTYGQFMEQFEKDSASWTGSEWADLFSKVGARYAVLTTKHHEGFCLWPTKVETKTVKELGFGGRGGTRSYSERDLVGFFASSMRSKGIKVGLYYSGGLDWHFKGPFSPTPLPHEGAPWFGSKTGIPDGKEYAQYADAHWKELIDKYHPDILWNDIGYPQEGRWMDFAADFYNRFPEGVINDRFKVCPAKSSGCGKEGVAHSDFESPEYESMKTIHPRKWETCRGIGYSFGYNRMEGEDDYMKPRELVTTFVDIVSKNGNLLLDVGPTSSGAIPQLQQQRLLDFGAWLKVNGGAIWDTEPMWNSICCGKTEMKEEVRYTRKLVPGQRTEVNAIVLGEAAQHQLKNGSSLFVLCPAPFNALEISRPEGKEEVPKTPPLPDACARCRSCWGCEGSGKLLTKTGGRDLRWRRSTLKAAEVELIGDSSLSADVAKLQEMLKECENMQQHGVVTAIVHEGGGEEETEKFAFTLQFWL